MKTLVATIFTNKDISRSEYAKQIIEVLTVHDLLPEKIGLDEPVRENYDLKRAVVLWQEGIGTPEFTSGGLLAKRKLPKIDYNFVWYKGERARLNFINIMFHGRNVLKDLERITMLFRSLLSTVSGVYGYLTDYEVQARQFLPGTLEKRLPGVFWCNYFGKHYVDFLTRDKLLSLQWAKIEKFEDGSLCFLTDRPDSPLLLSDNLEKDFRDKIGVEYFGRSELYQMDVKMTSQNTKAPDFDLSELQWKQGPS
jgi:hypothetical protein